MKQFRKNLAIALVAAQFLVMPGTGVYQAAAAVLKARPVGELGLRLTGARGFKAARLAPDRGIKGLDVKTGDLRAVSGLDRESVKAVEALSDAREGQRTFEGAAADGEITFDRASEQQPDTRTDAEVLAVMQERGNFAGSSDLPLLGRKSTVPAPAEKPGKLDTAINIGVIPGLAYSYGWVVPAMAALGTVIYYAFSTGINVVIPVNWPHYAMAAFGHASGVVSAALSPVVEPIKQFGQAAVELGKSNAVGMYVYGQFVQLYGYAAGALSTGIHFVADAAQQSRDFLLSNAPKTFDLSKAMGLKEIPAKNWYAVTAVLSNIAYYGKATLATDYVAQNYPRLSKNAAVKLSTRLFDLGLVAPAMLFKDGFQKLVKPFIQNIWDVVKDVAQWVYDYPLTFLGHAARSVSVGAFMGAVSAVAGPAVVVGSLAMNYIVTPSYRALKAAVSTPIGVAVLGGVLAVSGVGAFVYSASLIAWATSFGASVLTGTQTVWWILAWPFFAMGLGTGLYHGFSKKFFTALDETEKQIIGSRGGAEVFWKKAFSTFKKAEQEKN